MEFPTIFLRAHNTYSMISMHYVAGRQCAYIAKFGDSSVRHPSFVPRLRAWFVSFERRGNNSC